jgi:alpha-galactosidase
MEKTVQIELFDAYPGFALYQVSYRNLGTAPVTLDSWTNSALRLSHGSAAGEHSAGEPEPAFWSFCGSTHEDRRDWVQPVRPGFQQQNFMGMSASDYGGGTPIVDVWRKNWGIAVGHLETTPRLVSIPLTCTAGSLDLAMTAPVKRELQPGEEFNTP